MSNIDYQALAAQLLAKARGESYDKETTPKYDILSIPNKDIPIEPLSGEQLPSITQDSNKIIVALDSMQLGFIQACLRKYNLRHNLLIDSREHSKGINKGILMHEFLRFYYVARRSGETAKRSVEEGITHGRKKIPELNLEDSEVTETTRKFIEYGDKYTNETWEVIDVERPFSVDIYEDDHLIIVWEGIIDLHVRVGLEEYVVDHKTASRKEYWDELYNQLIGYSIAKKTKLIMMNEIVFLKTAGEGFNRSPLTMSKQIHDLFLESTVNSVKNYLAYAAMNYYPPNVHSCNQKYGCAYREFCKADDRTREWLLKTQYHYTTKWDPFTRG